LNSPFHRTQEHSCFVGEQMKTSENMRELSGQSHQAIKVHFVVG
jgi:hypothetical protein